MASKLIGAIVGTFKVGTGMKVGQPTFQPDRPKMTLRGGAFQINLISGDFKVVTPGKAKMTLNAEAVAVTHTFSLAVLPPRLTLKGREFRAIEPDKVRLGTPYLLLKGKAITLNRSSILQLGKARMLLKGGPVAKVGRTGLIPAPVAEEMLVPTEAASGGYLVPTPAYTELLVPTSVRVV